MRTNAAGFEFADAGIAAACIINPYDFVTILDVVFAGIEQAPIRREHAMAEEMPVRACRDYQRFGGTDRIDSHRPCAGATCEYDELARMGSLRDISCPRARERGFEKQLSISLQHPTEAVSSASAGRRCKAARRRMRVRRRFPARRSRRGDERLEQAASVNRHRGC